MNYRLYALIFTLSLAICPALQAMRGPRVNSLLMASRALHTSGLKAPKQALTRAYSTQSNGYKEQFKDNAYNAFDGKFIPAGAIAVGLAMATQHQLAEERKSRAIEKLDIYDIKAVLEVFKNGSEDAKRELAQRIAEKITNYAIDDIIVLLQQTTQRPHRILVNALAKNITSYTLSQIGQILKGDAQNETHDLMASALARNHAHFMGTSFWGFSDTNINEYVQTVKCFKTQYQEKIRIILAQEFGIEGPIDSFNTIDLFALLKNHHAGVQKIIIALFLEGKCTFNKGNIVEAFMSHLQEKREAAYELIKHEMELTDLDWKEVKRIFDQEKNKFAKPSKPDEQIIYEVNVSQDVKNIIADICKSRGITEQVVVRATSWDWTRPLSYRAASVHFEYVGQKKSYRHILSVNTWWCTLTTFTDVRCVLEHELGGHMANDHSFFKACLAHYLIDYKQVTTDNIVASHGFAALGKVDEYEADLFSAMHDDQVALHFKENLEWTIENRPSLYMSNKEHYQAVMAIIHLKEAAQKWSENEKAYNNPPVSDPWL